jgi:hypothetical protein
MLELAAQVKAKRPFLSTDHCPLNTVRTFPQVLAGDSATRTGSERGMKEKE